MGVFMPALRWNIGYTHHFLDEIHAHQGIDQSVFAEADPFTTPGLQKYQ